MSVLCLSPIMTTAVHTLDSQGLLWTTVLQSLTVLTIYDWHMCNSVILVALNIYRAMLGVATTCKLLMEPLLPPLYAISIIHIHRNMDKLYPFSLPIYQGLVLGLIPCQFTPFLNLLPLISSLTFFGWFTSIYYVFFLMGISFFIYVFFKYTHFGNITGM